MTTQPLVKPLSVIVRTELAKQMPEVTLAEDEEVVETVGPDGPHEAFGVRSAVWAARRDADALDTLRLQ